METQEFIVQATHHSQQTIICSLADKLLRNLPIPVVFFYRESVDQKTLIDSLKKVLGDFPIFAGTLKVKGDDLLLDCNNRGVLFAIAKEEGTVDDLLGELPTIEKKRLVHTIDPKQTVASQGPLMTIKVTYFACGGMVLGICWHHSVGDMHTFMYFMEAWSKTVSQADYAMPLIVESRDGYLQENLKDNHNTTPGVRYLKLKDLLELLFYMATKARDKVSLRFYFSDAELESMRQDFIKKSGENLSKNDVLCAHVFSIISDLDDYKKPRYLARAINYRSKMNLPDNIMGNFVSSINTFVHKELEPFQLAKQLRNSINSFEQVHADFFSTKRYIEAQAGSKKIDRFVGKSIDPVKRNLLMTSWANFGIFDVAFGELKPFYFSSFGDYPFPWISSLAEGFSGNGLIYSALLPTKLAKKLVQENTLQRIHNYRDPQESLPELAEKLAWLL
ncbi:acyltransferase [Leptolyngbya sp. CCNP1308]|uniref:acyltransferase n=1 Tax=Leptolyngbya sp. CCNP1308 TaxID=3110255 RepID=UPI002B21D460|nr:acyltransferase [Leptolyngbya sp. CCNP1308]MEA5448315.1 acyltransferase [Leptolyngbya sp. CCNP1308]